MFLNTSFSTANYNIPICAAAQKMDIAALPPAKIAAGMGAKIMQPWTCSPNRCGARASGSRDGGVECALVYTRGTR